MSLSSDMLLSANPIICIVGPTASGKSDLAQSISSELDGEVVSADSMQVYRGMDIGTGKVRACDRIVPHHCLDLVDPGEPFSAALFQEHAREAFADIDTRGKRIVLCGGTGFYVRAAIDDYDFPAGEQVGNALRDELNSFAAEQGSLALWDRLNERDPESAALIPPNDVKRVVRAFELLDEGLTYSGQREKLAHIRQLYACVFIGLSVTPHILVQRIDKRVEQMIEEGLVAEVESLLDAGFRKGICAPQAIGYKEIVQALDGACTLDEAIDQIKLATRRYAKRQRTWFRKDKRIAWLEADDGNVERLTNEALDIIHKAF